MASVNLCWERLEKVILLSKLSINAFSLHLGIPRSETLYQIKRGNNKISPALVSKIVAKYPQFNPVWLLTGYGPMFADGCSDLQVPFYKCDLSTILEVETMCPDHYIYAPLVGGANLALTYHDDDMEPSIERDTTLFLKRVEVDALTYGDEYVVAYNSRVLLRRVSQADEEDMLRLEAANRERFDDIYVAKSDVVAVYAVKARLKVKN